MSALLMFYEATKNPKKAFKMFICVIYTMIRNCVCIHFFAHELKKISALTVDIWGLLKHRNKSYNRILGIGIPYLWMNLMSCRGFLYNINPFVLLKCPKSMLEYYLSKILTLFDWNTDNLGKIPTEVKNRIITEDKVNIDKVVICFIKIPSTSNTQ